MVGRSATVHRVCCNILFFTPEEVTCFREGDYLMIGSAMNYTLGDGVGDSLSQDVAVYFDEAPNRKIPSGGVQTFASYF
jgi:hypothetical protein